MTNDVDPVAWYATKVEKKICTVFSKHIFHDLLMNLHLHKLIPTLPFKLAHDDGCTVSEKSREKQNDLAYTEQFIEDLKRYDPSKNGEKQKWVIKAVDIVNLKPLLRKLSDV